MIQPLPTDTNFRYSPDAGHPDCVCSRCGRRIREGEFALRCWTTNEEEEVDEHSREYRYCERCQKDMGVSFGTASMPDADLDFGLFDPYYDQDMEGLL